jgi:putative transposase
MARRPNPALHGLWRDRVSRQLRSGLSVEQFCARERCARSAFYRWKRQLDLMPSSDQCPALPTPSTPAPSTFLPVTVRLVDSVAHQPASIEADLPNGIHLRIRTANPQLACRLVRAIAGAKTSSGGPR